MGRRAKADKDFKVEMALKNTKVEVVGTYVNSLTKVAVRCLFCSDEYAGDVKNLLRGSGCNACASKAAGDTFRLSQPEYIEKISRLPEPCFKLSGDFYDTRTKVEHECLTCGEIKKIRPSSVLMGTKCMACERKKLGESQRFDNAKHIEMLKSLPEQKFELFGDYVCSRTKVDYKCLSCGAVSKKQPNNVLSGTGCSSCSTGSGFNIKESALLYYFSAPDSTGKRWYKLGITNRTLEARYGKELVLKMVRLQEWRMSGRLAQAIERSIHEKHRGLYEEAPKDIFGRHGGHTECYPVDILEKQLGSSFNFNL